MLAELHIENLGVIERLDVVLGPGLVVFTGETGAGKTMVVEAVDLLVGGRADATIVRAGASEARVEGRFVVADEEWVVARVVPVDGRSRAYVNGRLATVGQLAELGERLVDVHGQHAHQSLMSAAVQRAALDEYAGTDLGPLRATRARLTEIDASLAALGGDQRSRLREVELLRYQVTEIEAAGLDDHDEEIALEREEDLLADATAHREAAAAALDGLADDRGVLDLLGEVTARLASRAPFDEVVTRLRSVAAELSDVASELRRAAEGIEDDPARLEEVRRRRQLLRDLCRKYGETLGDVVAYGASGRERLAELESFDERVAGLESERASVEREERRAAAVVARVRRERAADLAAAVTGHLRTLAMQKAQVTVAVEGDDPADEVSFRLAANPGLPPAPLVKAASGGELARTMLALRLVLSSGPPMLVFDEVDAGIGGQAANAVASALAELARRHQILVVTHLAQVAAAADRHVVVDKTFVVRDGVESTVAEARLVTGSDREIEVARMLSGQADSPAARRHARELLESARKSRMS